MMLLVKRAASSSRRIVFQAEGHDGIDQRVDQALTRKGLRKELAEILKADEFGRRQVLQRVRLYQKDVAVGTMKRTP